jgi:hypothetical protein
MPNNSFKPTPHRGVGHVPTLRLHVSATPPRGGLTQALGGEKLSAVVLLVAAVHRLHLAVLFGQIVGTLPLRPSPQGALTHPIRCVYRLRERCLSCVQFVSI